MIPTNAVSLDVPLHKVLLRLTVLSHEFHAYWRVLNRVKDPIGPILHKVLAMSPINTAGEPISSPSANRINPGGAMVSTVCLK